jgi:hypothetical protein
MNRASIDRSCVLKYALLPSAILLLSLGGSPASSQDAQAAPMPDGYIFINGRYVTPPYEIRLTRKAISINGEEFGADAFDLSKYESPRRDSPRAMRMGAPIMKGRTRAESRPIQSTRSRLVRFSRELDGATFGMLVVLYEHRAPLFLYPIRGGADLLKTLTGSGSKDSARRWLSSESDRATWDHLVSEFQSTDGFTERATKDINRCEEAARAGDRIAQANLWGDRISYPLTVFAMAIVVLGFGHLLSNRPQLDESEAESADCSKRRRVVAKSLVIVALLSAVDLIWTMAAASSGSMRELNPLGSELIRNPSQLVLVKVTFTGVSIGILYWLHRLPFAQTASWWCCLLMTLLTARWVVFQSMFL